MEGSRIEFTSFVPIFTMELYTHGMELYTSFGKIVTGRNLQFFHLNTIVPRDESSFHCEVMNSERGFSQIDRLSQSKHSQDPRQYEWKHTTMYCIILSYREGTLPRMDRRMEGMKE